MEQEPTINIKRSYTEILEVLKYIDERYVEKVPKGLINFFKENKAEDYEFVYNDKLELDKQNLDRNTLALLGILNLNYWCEDKQHKKDLKDLYALNEEKYQKELHDKYKTDNLIKNHDSEYDFKKNYTNQTELTEYKESVLMKFINKIKAIFHIN